MFQQIQLEIYKFMSLQIEFYTVYKLNCQAFEGDFVIIKYKLD